MAQASVLDLGLFNIVRNSWCRILQSGKLITSEKQTKLEGTYYVAASS